MTGSRSTRVLPMSRLSLRVIRVKTETMLSNLQVVFSRETLTSLSNTTFRLFSFFPWSLNTRESLSWRGKALGD